MAIGFQIGGGIPGAAQWFQLNSEKIFDWLEIPNDSALLKLFRQEAKERILCNLKGERWQGERFMYGGLFIEEMRDILRANGYTRPDGTSKDSIRSLKSSACLDRIWNFSVRITQGAARWYLDMDLIGLENEPCYELVCENQIWLERWVNLGGKLYEGNRMIAHKTYQIWTELSDFKLPWPPFNLENEANLYLMGISIHEAEDLGVMC